MDNFEVNNARVKLIILDDHPLVGRNLAYLLTSSRPQMHVSVVTSFAEIEVELLNLDFADLLVADVWLAHGDMLSQLAQFRHKSSSTKCLSITERQVEE
jgi:DNA-binding NarL/FixJ family response regulator